jgi:hypothetical protein
MGGVEAWITVGDKVPAKEYAVDIDNETGVATCWISGEPGQTFAIRWRDISDPVACPVIDGYYSDPYVLQRDLSGFVMMDGYELGGRVLHARSHAPAIFSRIATSSTSCVPLTFSDLPRTAGIGEDWNTLGTISLDLHLVQIGEANRLHEGYSSYYRRSEAVPLSSATPFSSTEVTSLRKIATFIFKYRPLDVLQYHSIVPKSVVSSATAILPHLGEKRLASGDYSDTDSCHTESDEDCPSRVDGDTLSPTFIFPSSDSDSSQDFTQRARPKRHCRSPSYYGSQFHKAPPAKRIKL